MSAKVRMADALLCGVGGRTVLLRMPATAVSGDLGEQLGLGIPGFQDVILGPAVFRRVRTVVKPMGVESELLISASAVNKAVGSLAFGSAGLLFSTAAGVLVDGVLHAIVSVVSAEAFGEVYLYRVGLRSPVV